MYNKHILLLIIITAIAYCGYYWLNVQYIITNIFIIATSFMLLSLTGFNIIILIIILKTKGLVKVFDNRKKNKTELSVIVSYYSYSIAANLIAATMILASINKAVTPVLFSVLALSITCFYLCFKIFTNLFIRASSK